MTNEHQAPPSTLGSSSSPSTLSAEAPKIGIEYYSALVEKYGKIIAFGAGLDFLLGYMFIAVAAYQNKLGFIPPVQTQCLLAGCIPVLLLAIIIAIGSTRHWVIEGIIQWMLKPKTDEGKKNRYISIVNVLGITTLVLVGYIVYVLYARLSHKATLFLILAKFPIIPGIAVYVIFLTIAGLITYHANEYFETENFHKAIKDTVNSSLEELHRTDLNAEDLVKELSSKGYIFSLVTEAVKNITHNLHRKQIIVYQSWLAITVTLAWPSIFISLPQEFGGMRPRFAYVDVKKDSLSPETRNLLLPIRTADVVSRSRRLAVYYESDGTLFVRPANASTQTPVQEVKKDAIEGVTWCGYDPTSPSAPPKK